MHEPFGGPRGRARRGEARYILLDALRGGPKHGYEIIKSLEERSGGRYTPSPGTVYPTMQLLEDLGLVRADKDAERRVYHLTEAGQADLDSHAQEIADFWERFAAASPANQPEAGYVREEMESLVRTVWEGLRGPGSAASTETIKKVRLALERCRSEIREILAQMNAHKTIAIVGGGPGGLTLARLLQMHGLDVKVYERDAGRNARAQGGTLDLHEDSGLKALHHAGLMEAFRANYRPGADKMTVFDRHADVLMDDLGGGEIGSERPEIDRGRLRDILLDSLAAGTVVWGCHFQALTQTGSGIRIDFANGTSADADIRPLA